MISTQLGFPPPALGRMLSIYGLVDPFCSFQKAGAGISGVGLLGTVCEAVGEGKRHVKGKGFNEGKRQAR